jgi:hypothetical protein
MAIPLFNRYNGYQTIGTKKESKKEIDLGMHVGMAYITHNVL